MFGKWLSKEEKSTLSPEARKELRKQRRAQATADGERWYQRLFQALELDYKIVFRKDRLDDIIVESIQEVKDLGDVDTYTRINAIVDVAVDRADELVDFSNVVIKIGAFPINIGTAIEKYDSPILKWALKGLITEAVLARLADPQAEKAVL